MNDNLNEIAFDMPKNKFNAIKVIGVGGGGSNAVDYMFQQDIKGVDFVICNTDAQALDNSPIPNKIQLGANLTDGMGAGANPDVGAKAAEESYNELRELLATNTKMVFITAGMGGGTGTGAAPIIAKIAKELELLTVGIVTIPFEFEGKSRMQQAQKGIAALREQVDSLIIINNNKLREVYGNLGYKSGFAKADEVLSTAARGIAEVITHHYKQNIDLNDAKAVLSNSGTAIMGSSTAFGEDRAQKAIAGALDSPLLNDNKITGAKNVLLLIVSGTDEVTIDEIGEINDHIRYEAGYDVNIILGIGDDENIGDAIAVTIIATGFSSGQQNEITETEVKKIVHSLEEEQELKFDFSDKKQEPKAVEPLEDSDSFEDKVIHTLEEEKEELFEMIPTSDFIKDIDIIYDEVVAEIDDSDIVISEVKNEDFDIIEEDNDSYKQMKLTFDFPINQDENEPFELTDEIKNIEVVDEFVINEIEEPIDNKVNIDELDVVDAVQIEAVFDEVTTTHDLGMFEDDEKEITPKKKVIKTENDADLQFELKIVAEEKKPVENKHVETGDNSKKEMISPLNASIAEFKKTANDRRMHLKNRNYIFHNNPSNIEDIEKEPAYKRHNIELDDTPASSDINKSRTTIDIDENDEIQLRSNNSFLHDNVD
jgi:cell division protein FtsZ